jgi:hypothetical protein
LTAANATSVGKVGPLSYSDKTDGDQQWVQQLLPEPPSDSAAFLTWHRLDFELPGKQPGCWIPWLVRLRASGNGFIYLNGHGVGRYWQNGKQSDYYLPECLLNYGPGQQNHVTLCLRSVVRPAAIESAEIIPYNVYAERR